MEETRPSRVHRLLGGVYALAALALVGGMLGGAIVAVVWHTLVFDSGSCDVQGVAGDVLPSVVTVSVTMGDRGGSGSGVIVETPITGADDGESEGETYIVSNDHVTALGRHGATIEVTYADGHTSAATLVGGDPVTDLSVLQADDPSDNAQCGHGRRLGRRPGRAAGGRARRSAGPAVHRDRRDRQRYGTHRLGPQGRGRAHLPRSAPSRPTPRSTPATAGARSSTARDGWSASTPPGRRPRATPAASASTSRSRPR